MCFLHVYRYACNNLERVSRVSASGSQGVQDQSSTSSALQRVLVYKFIYVHIVKSTSTGLALSQCNHSPVTLFYDFASSSTCAATPECVRSDRTAT